MLPLLDGSLVDRILKHCRHLVEMAQDKYESINFEILIKSKVILLHKESNKLMRRKYDKQNMNRMNGYFSHTSLNTESM